MNHDLKKLFDKIYHTPNNWPIPVEYKSRPEKLLALFKKWNISSIFDAGCGERSWMQHNQFKQNGIEYSCGDISTSSVTYCKETWPDITVLLHDMTTDPFPVVDLVFSNDVAIHLSNQDRLKFLHNFLNSGAEYLLMTCNGELINHDCEYQGNFFESTINWVVEPWNFPTELDSINDFNQEDIPDKSLRLWNRTQIQGALTEK